jgi:hypothetical protein
MQSTSLKTFLLLSCLLVFGQTYATSIQTETQEGINPPKWEKLGQRKVNYKLDRDEVLVTARDGRFNAVKLKVRKGGVNMHKMTIHFGDGTSQNVNMKNTIPAGGETRVVKLKGKKKRVIRKVVFWYDTKNLANKKAVVELWGKH